MTRNLPRITLAMLGHIPILFQYTFFDATWANDADIARRDALTQVAARPIDAPTLEGVVARAGHRITLLTFGMVTGGRGANRSPRIRADRILDEGCEDGLACCRVAARGKTTRIRAEAYLARPVGLNRRR